MTKLVLVLLLVAFFTSGALGLSCIECPPEKRNGGCGVKKEDCKFGIGKDACNCCNVCLKGKGESCGGSFNIEGNCAKPLECMFSAQEYDYGMAGVCIGDSPTIYKAPANQLSPDKKNVTKPNSDLSDDPNVEVPPSDKPFGTERQIPHYKIVTDNAILKTRYNNPNGDTKCISAFRKLSVKTVSLKITQDYVSCNFYKSNVDSLQLEYEEGDDKVKYLVVEKGPEGPARLDKKNVTKPNAGSDIYLSDDPNSDVRPSVKLEFLTGPSGKELRIPNYKIVSDNAILKTQYNNPNGDTKCINAFRRSPAKTVSIKIFKDYVFCYFYDTNIHGLELQYEEGDDTAKYLILAKEMYFNHWFSHIDFQFYAFTSYDHSFNTAKENCKAHNGNLAILKSDLEKKAFVEFVTYSLGLKESGSYFIDLTFNMDSNSVVWGDGTPFKESTVPLVDENKSNRNKMYVAVFENGMLIEYKSLFNRNDYVVIPGIDGVCQINPFNV